MATRSCDSHSHYLTHLECVCVYVCVLSYNTIKNRRVYLARQGRVAKVVRSAKEKWVESVVAEAETT